MRTAPVQPDTSRTATMRVKTMNPAGGRVQARTLQAKMDHGQMDYGQMGHGRRVHGCRVQQRHGLGPPGPDRAVMMGRLMGSSLGMGGLGVGGLMRRGLVKGRLRGGPFAPDHRQRARCLRGQRRWLCDGHPGRSGRCSPGSSGSRVTQIRGQRVHMLHQPGDALLQFGKAGGGSGALLIKDRHLVDGAGTPLGQQGELGRKNFSSRGSPMVPRTARDRTERFDRRGIMPERRPQAARTAADKSAYATDPSPHTIDRSCSV